MQPPQKEQDQKTAASGASEHRSTGAPERRATSADAPAWSLHISPRVRQRYLQIRREVLDRVYLIQKNAGLVMRHEAEIMGCNQRLGADDLHKSMRWDLRGRRRAAQAEIDYLTEKSAVLREEIEVYRYVLTDDPPTWFIRLRRWLSLQLWI